MSDSLLSQLSIELYKCLVRPHLEYAVPAWAITTEMGIKLLEKVQGVFTTHYGHKDAFNN